MMSDRDAEARRYHRRQFALAVVDAVVGAGVLVAWTWSGAAGWLATLHQARLGSPAAVVAAMVLAIGASHALVTLPLDVWAGFVLPRRAGLLTQRFGGWLVDRAKGLAIGGGLALLAAEVVYGLLRWSPAWWWLWSAAILWACALLLTAVVPTWLAPLFYRLTPLEDPVLQTRVLALAARMGVRAAEVAVADLSTKGRTANAAVVGLGRTRRILVSDTLLGAFPPEEIEVVLAHELAHHARGDMTRGLVLQGAVMLAALGVADRALRAGVPRLALGGPADPAGLPFLALVLSVLGLVATPLVAAWSRRVERAADRVALDVTRDPAAFVAAMERLGQLNLAERRPGRLRQWLTATHPPLEARIAMGREAAAHAAARSGPAVQAHPPSRRASG
jgi:STE24 endopeptidase